jgi:hypothetical protein
MSDRFERDHRQSKDRDADGNLALRARQQMRTAVSNLRASFNPEVLARPDEPTDGEAGDDPPAGRRFEKRRP